MKKTPLAEEHELLGAKMVDFSGWWMPIQYQGLMEEHRCVREKVGLFDVSHMGEIRFKGPKALETLEWLTTNEVSRLQAGDAQYSLLPNEAGGLVDDIIIYCIEPESDYLVCVNASNIEKDFAWMQKHNRGADITNESDQWGQIAVQGPRANELIFQVLGVRTSQMRAFKTQSGRFKGHEVIVATTGYTGEPGGEIFIKAAGTVELWRALLDAGQAMGAQPIGLGARDTLRTEMKYSLYGHEINDTTNPLEAGLGWVVKLEAKEFIGQSAIQNVRAHGLSKKLIGFKMKEKGIPRQGYTLHAANGAEIGHVTSGTHSPSLNEPIGIGYVKMGYAMDETEIWVDIRGRKVKALVCKTPFYHRP